MLGLDSTNPDRNFYDQQDGERGLPRGLRLSYVRWLAAAGTVFLPSLFVTAITKQHVMFTVYLEDEFNPP